MATLGPLRQRAVSKVFGDGASGLIAASAIAWVIEQLRSSRQDAHVLDTARLLPGETYTVRTRPPMDRTERRLAARLEQSSKALEAAERPSSGQRRAALRLRRTQRRADRRPHDLRRAAAAQAAGARFDRVMAPSSKHQGLIDEVRRLETELDARRDAAIAAQGRRRRPPRTRRFL